MNKIKFSFLIIITIFTALVTSVYAQKKNTASLEIILSDHEPLQLMVNDRIFNQINRKLHITELPHGKIFIEVTRICENDEDHYCNKVVFSGDVVLEKNKHHQAVVLVGEGELVLSDKNNLFDANLNLDEMNDDKENQLNEILPAEFLMTYKQQLLPHWQELNVSLSNLQSDVEKNKAISSAVEQHGQIRSQDLAVLLSSMYFDEEKKECLKNIYPYIEDKNNRDVLKYAFTLESNYNHTIQSLN